MAKKRTNQAVPTMAPGQDDWAARNDADTLLRAEEIKADGKRHTAAKTHLRKQHKLTARAAGMKPAQVKAAADMARQMRGKY